MAGVVVHDGSVQAGYVEEYYNVYKVYCLFVVDVCNNLQPVLTPADMISTTPKMLVACAKTKTQRRYVRDTNLWQELMPPTA